MTTIVSAIYHDKEGVTDAVEELVAKSVPVDQISVMIQDASGTATREIEVENEMGTLKGAVIGGSVGAALGAVGVTLVATGVVLAPGSAVLAAGPITAALQGALGGAALGVPLGGLLGLGHWEGEEELREADLTSGAALVAVHSDDHAATARRIFEETGASTVTG